MSTIAAPPRPVPVTHITSEVNTSAGIHVDDSKGDKSGAVDIPIATFVPEEDIDDLVFPHKILRLLLICDGVAVFAPIIINFCDTLISIIDDVAALEPVLSILSAMLSLLSIIASNLALVLACVLHSKTFSGEHESSTKQIMWTHVAIFIIEIILLLSVFLGFGEFGIFFMFIEPIWRTITICMMTLALIALPITCFVLDFKLHKKIKFADNETVESSAAQSLIETDGIEIV